MFAKLTRLTVDEKGFLVDDRGIRYRRGTPVSTVQLKLYGKPYVSETPLKTGVFARLSRDLEAPFPKPNAWLDTGVVSEGVEILELPDIDLDGTVRTSPREVAYKFRKFELYHLGK